MLENKSQCNSKRNEKILGLLATRNYKRHEGENYINC